MASYYPETSILISFICNQLFLLSDNRNNTYTSFKDFSVVGIWQEKSEIIVITDIKQKIVIIQVIVLQRFSYYRQIGITPTLSLLAV